jgi:hypothetical protein
MYVTEFSDSKPHDPHQTLLSIFAHLISGTLEMIDTRRVPSFARDFHPQTLNDEEVATLGKVLVNLKELQRRIVDDPKVKDVSLEHVFTSSDTVRVFRNANVKTVMELWSHEPRQVPTMFIHSMALGGLLGKHQLHMYLFAHPE